MKYRWTILVLGLGLTVVGRAPLAPAQADCYTICQQSCYGPGMTSSDQYFCSARVQQCQKDCNARSQPKADAYGAIAYGAKSTAFGYAFGKGDAKDAEKTALDNCRQNGNDCRIVASYSNTCAAVAAVESKGVFTVASGASGQALARRNAMSDCERQYGEGCQIEVSTCSLP